jgi:hypothetical protein
MGMAGQDLEEVSRSIQRIHIFGKG